MATSPASPPEGVTDADWVEQQATTDPLEEYDATATLATGPSDTVEADDADLAEQETVVPLDDEQ